MPKFLARIFYSLRGKRMVRIHIADSDGTSHPSFEGILVGRWAGHYILMKPKMIEEEDHKSALQGTVEIPASRVLFVQDLSA